MAPGAESTTPEIVVNEAILAEPLPSRSTEVFALDRVIERASNDPQFDVAKLFQLLELKGRWEAANAHKQYVRAMARFKVEPITILKSKAVDVPGGAKYSHATLADVVDGVVSTLARFGLQHKWIPKQEENGEISITCVITHVDGHSESTTLRAPPDKTGSKNTIQSIGSTVTYLERYTLMAACGLAARDMDDDALASAAGAQAGEPAPEGYEDWRADMNALADEGSERLAMAWKDSQASFRRYVVKYDEAWWEDVKKKAAKVSRSATPQNATQNDATK